MSSRHLVNEQLIFHESWTWQTETEMDVTLEAAGKFFCAASPLIPELYQI